MDERNVRAGRQKREQVGRIDAERVALRASAARLRGVEARDRQARVIVHEVEPDLDAGADRLEVILERHAELSARAWASVGYAVDVRGGIAEPGQRRVERASELLRVFGDVAGADADRIDRIARADVEIGEIAARRDGFDAFPFELVEHLRLIPLKGSRLTKAMLIGVKTSSVLLPMRYRLFALTGLAWLRLLMTSVVLSPQLTVCRPSLKLSLRSPAIGSWPKTLRSSS